jgi:hypothetical protein
MTDQTTIPNGTPVYVSLRVKGWPETVRGTVAGYTDDGRVKVKTGTGIRIFVPYKVHRR